MVGSTPNPQLDDRADRASPLIVIDSDRAVARFRYSVLSPTPKPSGTVFIDESVFGTGGRLLEPRMNELYSDCGCGAGMVGVVVAVIGYAVWLFASAASINWTTGFRGLGIVFTAAVIGKGIGLVRNRLALSLLVSSLEAQAAGPRKRGYG